MSYRFFFQSNYAMYVIFIWLMTTNKSMKMSLNLDYSLDILISLLKGFIDDYGVTIGKSYNVNSHKNKLKIM